MEVVDDWTFWIMDGKMGGVAMCKMGTQYMDG